VTLSDGEIGVTDADLCSTTFVMFPGQFTNVTPTRPSAPVQGAVAVPQAPPVQQVGVPQSRPAEVQRLFSVRNTNSRWAIVEVNVARAESRSWGENMLDNIINPGQTGTASFWTPNVNHCLWDVRVMSSDGFEDFNNNVNLCQPFTFIFR
jgi:hypothetical protein